MNSTESGHLPQGWANVMLDQVGVLYCGQSPSVSHVNEKGNGTPYVTGPDQWNGKTIRASKWTTDPRRTVPDGCIFVTVKGAGVGKLFPGIACAIGRDVYAYYPSKAIAKSYVYLALRHTIDDIVRHAAGLIPGLSKDHLMSHALALPPLAEQYRIVAAVERILARVSSARERLERVPATMKRFRQAALAAACSGRLTADWRQRNSNLTFLPEAVANSDSVKAGEWPDELPPEWRFATVARVSAIVVDCPHSTPKWTDAGEVCLRTTNFLAGRLDLREVRRVSHVTYADRIRRVEPKSGDIVYSREGGILGIACQIPEGLRACLGQRMMLMRMNHWMNATFTMHVLNSPITEKLVKELTGGTAAPHLNVGDVKKFSVPVPTFDEQCEIVRRVSALFALADAIEQRAASALRRVESLTQSVLAKAFRGELVPTEAELARRECRTYETAAQLLERIQSEAGPKQAKKKAKK